MLGTGGRGFVGSRAVLVALLLVSVFAVPALADSGTYACTAMAGGQVEGPNGNAYGITVNLGERGIGGCNLHVLRTESKLVDKDPGDRCEITVDIGGNQGPDQRVDEVAKVNKTYPESTVFDAFCYIGALVAHNSITLADPPRSG